jgi:hypothetical protein
VQSELQNRASAESGDREVPTAISVRLLTLAVKGFERLTSLPFVLVKTPKGVPPPFGTGDVMSCLRVLAPATPEGGTGRSRGVLPKGQFVQMLKDMVGYLLGSSHIPT